MNKKIVIFLFILALIGAMALVVVVVNNKQVKLNKKYKQAELLSLKEEVSSNGYEFINLNVIPLAKQMNDKKLLIHIKKSYSDNKITRKEFYKIRELFNNLEEKKLLAIVKNNLSTTLIKL